MRVGLFSPMGTGNLGDASIQEAMIKNLRQRVPGIEIYGFSLNADDTESRHKIPSYPIAQIHWNQSGSKENASSSPFLHALMSNRLMRIVRRLLIRIPQEIMFNLRAFRRVRKLNMVVFSGGGQLADEWGGAIGHPYAMLRWALLARICRIPVVFASIGAGPLSSGLSRAFARWALSLARYRSFRDEESKHYMATLGFDRSDPVVPDIAHSLPDNAMRVATKEPRNPMVIGISPIAYGAPRQWRERQAPEYITYLDKLADFVGSMAKSGISVRFFPSAIPADEYVIKELSDRVVAKFGSFPHVSQVPVTTVPDLLSAISEVDVVVASRFHGVLLPFVLHKPVVAISYHPKVDSLMQDMEQHMCRLDIETFTAEHLKSCIEYVCAHYNDITTTVSKKETIHKSLLATQYDTIVQYLDYGATEMPSPHRDLVLPQ